jgi:hypothetical protein
MTQYNWEERDILSLGPKFRIDTNNPQVGDDGADVYNLYAVNSSKDVSLLGLSEGGTQRIYSDRNIEIIAGAKNKETGVDIIIAGKNGDVVITAERTGKVKIKGLNIMIEADEDVDIKAGRNINLKSGSGRVLLRGNKVDALGLTGNLIEDSFGVSSFLGSFVGGDILNSVFSAGTSLLSGGNLIDTAISAGTSLIGEGSFIENALGDSFELF